MGRRAKNPNAIRMFQMRLDPTNAEDAQLIEFLDSQDRWQSSMKVLMQNQYQQTGSSDVFRAYALQSMGQTSTPSVPTDKPTQTPVATPAKPVSQPTNSVSKPVEAPVSQVSLSNAGQHPNVNQFANSQTNNPSGADLKNDNNSFRNLM